MEDKELALYSSSESSLRDYLKVFFRYKAIIIIMLVVVMSTVFIRRELVTPQYIATVKMLVYGQSRPDVGHYKQIINPRGLINIQGSIIDSRSVMERVVKALKLHQRPLDEETKYVRKLKAILIKHRVKDLKLRLEEMDTEQRNDFLFNMAMERLRSSVSTSYDENALSNIYMIHVRDFDPSAAKTIANAVANSLLIFNLEQDIAEFKLIYGEKHSIIIRLKNYIKELSKKLDGKMLPDIEAMGPASVKILEQAQLSSPSGGMSSTRIIIIFFVSLLFACFVVYVFDLLDQTFRTPQDIERYLHIPFLGSIPERKSNDKVLISDANPETTDFTKAFQVLSDQLYLLMKNKNLKSLLMVSTGRSLESFSLIANLSIYLAFKAGHKVMIIDADLRSPSLNKTFRISDSPGLNDVLERKVSFEDAIQSLDPNLYVLPTNKASVNPVTLLDSSTMSDLIKQVKDKFDIIFINCADMKNFTDATTVSAFAEGVAIIINEGKDRRHILKKAVDHLRQRNANIVGAILNNRKYVIPKIIYKLT